MSTSLYLRQAYREFILYHNIASKVKLFKGRNTVNPFQTLQMLPFKKSDIVDAFYVITNWREWAASFLVSYIMSAHSITHLEKIGKTVALAARESLPFGLVWRLLQNRGIDYPKLADISHSEMWVPYFSKLRKRGTIRKFVLSQLLIVLYFERMILQKTLTSK